jgi:integrase
MRQSTKENTGVSASVEVLSLAHFHSLRGTKSVQEVSKPRKRLRHARTDLRYWEQAVFLPTYTKGGERRTVGEWAAKIQHGGRRETFGLGTSNKAAAADKAKRIYLSLHAAGWEATLADYKPKAAKKQPVSTIGEFIEDVKVKVNRRPKTLEGYARALRTIAADIGKLDGGKSKYDAHNGGRAKWLAQVNAIKLDQLTPEAIQKWKVKFLRRAGNDPRKQRSASISANSLLQQAKSLFSAGILEFVEIAVPEAVPFAKVVFDERPSMRYRSSIDVAKIVREAQAELPREQLKMFLLAIMVGLRRDEIDKMEWSAFNWDRNVIGIELTANFKGKSEHSVNDIDVDPELMALFKTFKEMATGAFVIESEVAPRPGATYTHYRANKDFEKLTRWLRTHGAVGMRPLHTLRKEFGSQVNERHGIYAASQALRHRDIAITTQHYTDRRKSVAVGMGHLLTGSDKVIQMNATGIADDSPLQQKLDAK